MKEVSKFFGLKEGDIQVCNGWKFECTKVDKELAKKLDSAPCLFGALTSPTGEVTEYITKHTFASRLNKIAGVVSAVTIPAKKDNSQSHGTNKVVQAYQSASKQDKRFRKAYKLLKQASELYGLTDAFSGMIKQLQVLDSFTINCEKAKAKQAEEARKAEEAKQAEEARKANELAELIAKMAQERNTLLSYGMSQEQVAVMLSGKFGDSAKLIAE